MTIEDFVRQTRAVLAMSGFVRKEAGGTVYFESTGRAEARPTFVLVHGVNDQAGTWAAIAPALAKTHRVIVPDLPGHGESAPGDGPLPISLMVDRLDAILEHETSFTLLGNSLGGWISILYTLRRPEKITRLILESAGGLSLPLATPVTATTREGAIELLRAVHGPKFVAPDWAIDAVIARATDAPMLRVTEAMDHYVDARLGELRAPTTIVWGADDGVLPLPHAQTLARGIAGATLHVIDGAAHIPHLQQPERFLACLTATF